MAAVDLPTCDIVNNLPFVPCYQEQYIRPHMPPREFPTRFNLIIPPQSIHQCYIENDHIVSWRRHVRGDLVWYDFIRKRNLYKQGQTYEVSREWYLPGETVQRNTIAWITINRHSTLIDNGSPFMDTNGTLVLLKTCPACNVTEFNHNCGSTCTFCTATTKLHTCQLCTISRVCKAHNVGIDGACVCQTCLQKDVRCTACLQVLTEEQKRRGITKHKNCAMVQTSCVTRNEEGDCIRKRAANAPFEFKTKLFKKYWDDKTFPKVLDAGQFASIFSRLFLNKPYVYQDQLDLGTLNAEQLIVSEMCMSWRTAVLVLSRRNVPNLQSKTPKAIYDLFKTKFDPRNDITAEIKSFLGSDRLYNCHQVTYGILDLYGINREDLVKFFKTMVGMLKCLSDNAVTNENAQSAYDLKASKKVPQYLLKFDKIQTFTKQLQKLYSPDEPAVQLKTDVQQIEPFVMPVGASEEDRKKLEREHRLKFMLQKPQRVLSDDMFFEIRRKDGMLRMESRAIVHPNGSVTPGQYQELSPGGLLNVYNAIVRSFKDKIDHNKFAKKLGKPQNDVNQMHPLHGQFKLRRKESAHDAYKNVVDLFIWNPHIKRFNIRDSVITYYDETSVQIPNDVIKRGLEHTDFFRFVQNTYPDDYDKMKYEHIRYVLKRTKNNWKGQSYWVTLKSKLDKLHKIVYPNNYIVAPDPKDPEAPGGPKDPKDPDAPKDPKDPGGPNDADAPDAPKDAAIANDDSNAPKDPKDPDAPDGPKDADGQVPDDAVAPEVKPVYVEPTEDEWETIKSNPRYKELKKTINKLIKDVGDYMKLPK